MAVGTSRAEIHGAGRYEIGPELARGGMGVVYRVRDRRTGLALALKRSLGVDGDSAERIRSMLRREYQTLFTLRHPHIIRVYDFGVDQSGPYYTMELLEGVDLRSKCPLPWREVCSYLRDIASSLALLHSRRLLHRDVSPANIWLTGEGRAKLLDFGALGSFGRNTTVAGSPPTTAPETLVGEDLDQRVDLYALGATAYFALTGRHAFPAPSLAMLPAVWGCGRPAAPSTYAADIPAELDELVLSLLERDRVLRPNSAAEIIDRLEVVAGLAPDRDPRVLRSYLQSTAVVGRDGPRQLLSEKLEQTLAGRSAGVLIEGTTGLGKSFLLEEIEQQARMLGAQVLAVHARAHSGTRGVWSALLREVETQSAELAQRPMQAADSEQAVLELASVSPLLIAIEDIQEADTESLVALLALAKAVRRAPVMLVATLDPSHPQASRPALGLLRARLTSVKLAPFDEKATLALVRALFGDVPSASRLATFLHDHAAGSPQSCRAIIDHFIDQELIRYVDGMWVLPPELPAVSPDGLDLGALVRGSFESRIAHWNSALRNLAQCLSPVRRPFDLALSQVLTAGSPELSGANLPQFLGDLVREGILIDDHGSYTFARQSEQEFFYAQLDEARKQRQHLLLGDELAKRAGSDAKRTFEIGFHFVVAGELKKAREHLNRNVEESLRDPDMLTQSVPDLWALLKHLRKAGASDEEVQFVEGILVLAGYYVDPSVYDAFGERVLRVMHRTMGFALASRLAPFLGRHLALAVGMLVAWVKSLFRQPYLLNGGSFNASVLTFIGVCVSMNAGACARLDRKVFPMLFELLEVTSKLGRLNVLRYLYDQFKMGEHFAYARITEGHAQFADQFERLPKLPLLAGESAHQIEGGLLYGMGVSALKRNDMDVMELVDRLEAMKGKNDRLQAQFLRYQYHLYRGELVAAKREENAFDEISAQFGSRWGTDIHVAIAFAPYHLTADVLGLKRTLHRLEVLLPIAPGLATSYEVARAMYEGHRGRPDSALRRYEALGERIAPFADYSWSIAVGHKAECLNILGRHEEALAVCDAARRHLTEQDRAFVFLYQQFDREASIALAGLGRMAEAEKLSDKLIGENAICDNPLIGGLLHFDRARIARRAGDSLAFQHHALSAKQALASTQNPSAIARVNRLFETPRKVGAAGLSTASTLERTAASELLISPARRIKAVRVLQEIASTVAARSAHLFLVVDGAPVLCAQHGDDGPDASLVSELSRLTAALDGETRDPMFSQVLAQMSTEASRGAKLVPIVCSDADKARHLVGLVVVGESERGDVISQLDLSPFASELQEVDEATEVTSAQSA